MGNAATLDEFYYSVSVAPAATSNTNIIMGGWDVANPRRRSDDYSAPPPPQEAVTEDDPLWLEATLRSIDRIRSLGPVWDGYRSAPVPEKSVNAAVQLLFRVAGFRTPAPALVPTASGAVQLEWHQGQMDIEVYVSPDSTARAWVQDHLSDEETEVDISVDALPLVSALRQLTNRVAV